MHCRAAKLLWTVVLLAGASQAADYRKLFQKSDPSVVVLHTIERSVSRDSREGEVVLPGLGSGVLIDDDGHIITAAHVVQTADLVEVEFVDGTRVTAAVISSAPDKDVALLKLDRVPENTRPAELGDSDEMHVGDEVYVIGAPYGFEHTLSIGHISARRAGSEDSMGRVEVETFQTDAAINKGNSGGPMFNLRGEIIGIVSHISSRSGGSEGLGFAVTSNAAARALFEERVVWTGMSGILLTGDLAAAMNVPQASGFLVQKVASSSPAARVGLRASKIPANIGGRDLLIGGDILLSVQGIEISSKMMVEFRQKLDEMRQGDLVSIRVLRAGEIVEIEAPR